MKQSCSFVLAAYLGLLLVGVAAASQQTPFLLPDQNSTCKIAIVGAGAGGTSAAFWIAKVRQRFGIDVEVDIYELNDYVGGRSAVVWPHDDANVEPVELGASVFVKANKNLWRAVDEFNLERIGFENDDAVMGIWDGRQFRLTIGGGGFYSNWMDKLKIIWRYGLWAPQKTQKIVDGMIQDISALYGPTPPVFDNVSSLVASLGWTDVAAQHSLQYFRANNIADLWSYEFVDSMTRVNYGQDIERIHALEGLVSLAANGASSVKGGNFQIYEGFLRNSDASVFYNTRVQSLSRASSGRSWEIRSSSDTEVTRSYDAVLLAVPLHQTGIELHSEVGLAPVPEQPYVRLHVTILATSAPFANATYFNLEHGASVPSMILTTYDGARHGGSEPEFNSMNYLRPVRRLDGSVYTDAQGRPEWLVKIFSKARVSDAWLDGMFDGKVRWVHRKEWDAYPVLPPTTEFPPLKLGDGVYYVNAFEPLISTMETETVSARNAVELLLRDKFGVGICGPTSMLDSGGANGAGDDFVYGWDC